MDFADVEDQGYMPLYKRSKLTDALHEVCNFRTDYQFITRQKHRQKILPTNENTGHDNRPI